ncbi:serine hydrolase [Chitinophaga sp. Cy-1792]|uniref:serine hydrolase domain-containing protein n=1 Tax=Chitinophaga sp. Cy-1792 TaxID=2608339 RepID=UPI0014241324|nr:serine hydrolase domain-containing protein [Chitinophaga sp. Cy-1792]NIG52585.1 beta-lactamase family protein [Chitinophaga sp. Cy-1792]
MRRALINLGILLLALPTFCFAQTKNSDSVQEKIQQVENGLCGWVHTDNAAGWTIAERLAYHHVPGVSIAVIHNYKVEWAKGYGYADAESHTPVTVNTLFQAASMSKSLNAVAIVKLAQDKKLDLNTDINNYLKTWKFPYDTVSHNKKITIANLLTHTAGLNVHGFDGYAVGDSIPTITQILDGKRPANSPAVRSQFEPGVKMEYSGGGTTISQVILADVTGLPYDKFMNEKILKPLGMTSSSFTQPPPKEKQALLATGYSFTGTPVAGKYHIYPEEAAAGLWTTPSDYSKYVIETQLAYIGKSNRILTEEYTRKRLTPVLNSGTAMGSFIGEIGGNHYFMHSGGDEGFTCVHYGCLENGDGVVVMSNGNDDMLLMEIVNSVAKAYGWKDFYKPMEKHLLNINEVPASTYVGKYLFNGDTAVVNLDKGKLSINYSGINWEMNFTSPEEFFIYQMGMMFQFKKDEKGTVTGFNVGGKGFAKKID